MTQREIQDSDNVTWTCVQAFGGMSEEAAAEAAERIKSAEGKVPVVCTPSGGEQSVRVQLSKGWEEDLSDDDLVAAIQKARDARE